MKIRAIIIRSNQVAPDSRVEKETSALSKAGIDVRILAWDRRSNHRIEEDIIAFGQRIPIVRFGHKANFGDGLKSIRPYLAFQLDVFKWLITHKDEYDLIHACDFDTGWVSAFANLFLKKKYIFDIFDYLGGDRQTLRQRIVCKFQDLIINKADATIICTEKRKQQIKHSMPKKLVVIHNSPPKAESLSVSKKNSEVIKICYVGILQDYRLLDKIPDFFKKHPQYELHIGGFGKLDSYYYNLSKNYNNIKYYGRLQYDETLNLEKECDIMLAIYDPTIENHVFAAPNKFYEGLMLGKPLIMVKGTGMSEIIYKYGIGELIEYSTEGFEQGVIKLADRKEEWLEIHKKMVQLYEQYSWETMANRLVTLYGDLFD